MPSASVDLARDAKIASRPDTMTRYVILGRACVLSWALVVISPVSWANELITAGSYAADGECYCLMVPSEIEQRIVPTPIGEQSVAQICRRLGEGPGLRAFDRVPSYPTFTDVQCGHGPVPRGEARALDCDEVGIDEEGCVTRGPRWNLARVYAPGADRTNRADAKPSATAAGTDRTGQRRSEPPRTSRWAETSSSAPSTRDARITAARDADASSITASIEAPTRTSAEVLAANRAERGERAPPSPGNIALGVSPVTPSAAPSPDARSEEEMNTTDDARETDAAQPAVRLARAPDAEEPVVIVADAVPTETLPASIATDERRSATGTPDMDDVAITTVLGSRRSGAIERPDSYLELAAVSAADGRSGVGVEGSVEVVRGDAPLALQFRISAIDERRDARLGTGLRVRPTDVKRLSFALAAGLELGADETRSEGGADEPARDDTGLYLRATSEIELGARLRLSGGAEATTRFDGSYSVFGVTFLRVSPAFGVFARVQSGDAERAWIGLRYDR